MTPADLFKRLTKLGHPVSLTPNQEAIQLVRPSRYHVEPSGEFELPLEVRITHDGQMLKVIGPSLPFHEGAFALRVAQDLPEVQGCFHLLRFVKDWDHIRPEMSLVCLPRGSAVPDEAFTLLLTWAAEAFDASLGYLEKLASTGVRDRTFLSDPPPQLEHLKKEAGRLRTALQDTERAVENLSLSHAHSALTLPKFI